MKRQEALEHYKLNVAKDLIEEYTQKFELNLNNNEEKIRELLIEGIKSVEAKAKKIQEIEADYKICILQFELLRTNIINETYKIFIHGYNSSWYLDEKSVYEEIDLLLLFKPFIELKEKLIKFKKIYLGKVNNYDIQEIVFDLVSTCYKKMSMNVRNWMWNLDEIEFIKESPVLDTYVIRWGEYQNESEAIFAMDNREKYAENILEGKKKPKENLPFVYSVWKNSNLGNVDLSDENLIFINFKGSNLENIEFNKSDIIRGQFKDTNISYCNFNYAMLVGACFENSIIKKCSFENSNLTNSNFRNATFDKVSFERAIVDGAVFSEQQVPFLHLTPEQLQVIYIEGGE